MKRTLHYNPALVLFLALAILWIPWLGETLFYSKGEPREAIVAVSMLQSGDWILPVSGGCEIPYKPPFLAWLIASLAWLLNGGVVSEFIARLPSALAAVALVMATYSVVRRERGEEFALITSLILATSVEFYRAAVACRVDMVLTACMVGAMYLLYTIQVHRRHRDNFGLYCAAAALLSCATLTKGPVGSLLPCLAMGIFALLSHEKFWPTLGRLTALCLVSFVIPAVWYYFAWQRGGDEFARLVWEENIQRLTGSMPYESHVKPFWYNFVTILTGMLPWTLLALMAITAVNRWRMQALKPLGLFATTAALTVIIFYCIPSSKRSVYLLPAYPFIAYAVAAMAGTLSETRVNTAFGRIIAVICVLLPVTVVGLQIYPLIEFKIGFDSWWQYVILAIPAGVGCYWMTVANSRDSITGVCGLVWAALLAYGAALMPAIMNPLSDKPDAERLMAMAGDSNIYIVGADKHTRIAYALNYYMSDGIRRLPSTADADTCRVGTVLIFTLPCDTAGLPEDYRVSMLKERFSDTRHPAYYAVKVAEASLKAATADTAVRVSPAVTPVALPRPVRVVRNDTATSTATPTNPVPEKAAGVAPTAVQKPDSAPQMP